jgi:hypothetical protein
MATIEERVVVTREFVSLLFMQVCAVADATDEEILQVCNAQNECGTSAGWSWVVREGNAPTPEAKPGPCETYPGRLHFLAGC